MDLDEGPAYVARSSLRCRSRGWGNTKPIPTVPVGIAEAIHIRRGVLRKRFCWGRVVAVWPCRGRILAARRDMLDTLISAGDLDYGLI